MEINGQLQFKIKLFCFLKRKIYCYKKKKKKQQNSSKQLLRSCFGQLWDVLQHLFSLSFIIILASPWSLREDSIIQFFLQLGAAMRPNSG